MPNKNVFIHTMFMNATEVLMILIEVFIWKMWNAQKSTRKKKFFRNKNWKLGE